MYTLESRRPYVVSESENRYYERLKVNEQYEQFRSSLKKFLVSESINYLLQKNLLDKSTEQRKIGEALCEQFVEETGPDNLIRKFWKESYLLAEMANIIQETYDNVICKLDKNDNLTFCIKPTDKRSFYDNLDNLSTDEVIKKVQQRSCDAAADFIQANVNDKLDMESIAMKTQDRIDKIKAVSKEKKDAMIKEFTMIAKNESYKVRGRRRGIYEQIVVGISKQSMKPVNESSNIASIFVSENGKLDMDNIIETADTMYKFLETINTARIHKINENYLSSVLLSIK